MPFRLILPGSFYEALLAQAKSERPNECCGLLAGTLGTDGIARVFGHFPLPNALASPVLFECEPRAMLAAVRAIDRAGWEILAIYHSHPTSAPSPSKTDLACNYSEDVMNLIISLTTEPPTVRGWWLTADDYREAEWSVGVTSLPPELPASPQN